MTEKSNTGLAQARYKFWTAVIILIAKAPEIYALLSKVVSYGCRNPKLQIQL